MKLNRIAAAAAATAIATVAIVSGVAGTQHGAATVTLLADSHSVVSQSAKPAAHPASSHRAARKASPADLSLAWLESRGGQAQVTFNN